MKATEKKILENLYKKIDKELKKAEDETEQAYDNIIKSNFSKKAYNYYQQRYEYRSAMQMSKTIVVQELRKLGIEVK